MTPTPLKRMMFQALKDLSSDEKKLTTNNEESSTKALDDNDEEMEDVSSLSK